MAPRWFQDRGMEQNGSPRNWIVVKAVELKPCWSSIGLVTQRSRLEGRGAVQNIPPALEPQKNEEYQAFHAFSQ
jgi:hypothetical protein